MRQPTRPREDRRVLLNFDEERYVAIQTGAVALAAELRARIGDALDPTASAVFFVGAWVGRAY